MDTGPLLKKPVNATLGFSYVCCTPLYKYFNYFTLNEIISFYSRWFIKSLYIIKMVYHGKLIDIGHLPYRKKKIIIEIEQLWEHKVNLNRVWCRTKVPRLIKDSDNFIISAWMIELTPFHHKLSTITLPKSQFSYLCILNGASILSKLNQLRLCTDH